MKCFFLSLERNDMEAKGWAIVESGSLRYSLASLDLLRMPGIVNLRRRLEYRSKAEEFKTSDISITLNF